MLIIKNNGVKNICNDDFENIVNSAAFKNGIAAFETVKVIEKENGLATGEYLFEHYQRLIRTANKTGLTTNLEYKTLENCIENKGAIRISLCADL